MGLPHTTGRSAEIYNDTAIHARGWTSDCQAGTELCRYSLAQVEGFVKSCYVDIPYRGKHGVPVRSRVAAAEAWAEVYAGVIIPGGRAPHRLCLNRDLVCLVREAMEQGKVVAAICHGPQMPIEADVVRGRRATCYASVATDLKNADALYLDQEVVVDGNLVGAAAG